MPIVDIPQSRRVLPRRTGITDAPDLTAALRESQSAGARLAGTVGEFIQKEKVRKDTVYVANASVQAEREIEELKNQLRQSDENPEGHSERFFELSTEIYDRFREGAPSQESNLSLQQQFAGLQRGRLREESAFENSAIKARDLAAYEESSNDLDNALFGNPDNFELVLAQQGQLDETLKGILSPAQQASMIERRQETLATSYVKGLTARDPFEALEVLNSDSLDEILSSKQQQALVISANTKIERNKAEVQQQFNISHRKFIDGIKRNILTGDLDQGELDTLFNSESLSPDEYVTLSRMYNQKLDAEGDMIFSNAYIGGALRRSIPLDPTDKRVIQAVDTYYNEVIAPQLEDLEPEDANLAEISFINDVGIVPNTIISQVGAAISTGSSQAKADAAQFITALGFSSPRLSNVFGRTNLATAEKISINIASLGVEDAVKAAEVSVLERKTEQYKTKIRRFDIDRPEFDSDRFTDSFFEFFDGLPDTVPTGMEDQFVDILRTYVVDLEVPLVQAEKLAYQTLTAEWSVTDVNGIEEYMRFAPDAVYGSRGQGSEWITTQLRQDISSLRRKPVSEDEDFFFSPVATTFGSAGGVKYHIFQTDPVTGLEDAIKGPDGAPLLWKPSEQQESIRLMIEAEERRMSMIDEKVSDAELRIKAQTRAQEIEANIQSVKEGF